MASPKKNGFTLLEIILSMAILSFIAILTANSIQSSIKFKKKVSEKIDQESVVQDALKVMAEDLRLAFNYKDINIEVFNLAQDERKKRAEEKKKKGEKKDEGKEGEGDGGAGDGGDGTGGTTETKKDTTAGAESEKTFEKKEVKTVTQFLGDRDKINFTSLSYRRTIENSPLSNQAEIGYFLKDCRGRLDKRKRSRCLWRRVSPIIDKEIEEGGKETMLVENVNSLKFRYIGPGNEEKWRQDWFSDENGDAVTKGFFPYAVEITLEIARKGPDDKELKPMTMTAVAPISFPNNQKSAEEKAQEQVDGESSSTTKKQ